MADLVYLFLLLVLVLGGWEDATATQSILLEDVEVNLFSMLLFYFIFYIYFPPFFLHVFVLHVMPPPFFFSRPRLSLFLLWVPLLSLMFL